MSNDETIPYLEGLYKSLLEDAEHVAKTIELARLRQFGISSENAKAGESPKEAAKGLDTGASGFAADAALINLGPYHKYDKDASYKSKMILILSVEKRFLTVKEVSDIIYSLEPHQKYETIKQAIGGTKSSLLRDEKIIKYVVGPSHNNSFYGSKQWLNEDGSIKPEHMYNENALYIPKQDEIEL